MRRVLAAATALAAVCGVALTATAEEAPPPLVTDPAAYVNPLIGTSGSGFTVPGAATPFGLTQVSPDTTGPVAYTGYSYQDAQIRGFSLLHINAAGVPIAADLPFLPVLGDPVGTDPVQYAVPFTHADEQAGAGAYEVTLGNGVRVELAATPRGGLQRYTAPPGLPLSVIADVGRNAAGVHESTVTALGSDRLEGSSLVQWRGGDYRAHFSARFSRPFELARTFVGAAISDAPEATGTGAGAILRFAPGAPVTMAVGVSLVDLAGARRNLATEIPAYDVDAAQAAARRAWTRELSRVRVGGGTTGELRTFYTALYRAFVHPNVASDVDGRYLGADGAIHTTDPAHPYYENFSLWDTIRGQNALLATLQRDRYADMMRSLSLFAAQSPEGLPRWSLHNAKPNYMNGDPALPTLAEAICRGIDTGVDDDVLYAQMRRLAYDARRADYLSLGWVPGSAADTLEYAMADFALALVADRIGAPDTADLARRSLAWRHLFKDGFLQPRAADGSFPASYDPKTETGYREGTGWQYRWLAPHDQAGLVAANGGRTAYADALDHLFTVPASTAVPGLPVVPAVHSTESVFGTVYYGDHYVPGNEHDLEAPWLYNWTDRPATTQAVLAANRSLFMDHPLGLPGNDDLGSLSAWYVWAALGFHPVVPGAPLLVVGSPLFPRAELDLADGRAKPFTVDAPGAGPQTPYVASAQLDGRPLDRSWFLADALHPGGGLRFAVGSSPTAWAAGPQAAPPSLSTDGLAAFGCRKDPS